MEGSPKETEALRQQNITEKKGKGRELAIGAESTKKAEIRKN